MLRVYALYTAISRIEYHPRFASECVQILAPGATMVCGRRRLFKRDSC